MRKIKKTIVAVMTVVTIFSMSACGKSAGESRALSPRETSTKGAADKVPDPNAPKMEIVSVYIPNTDGTGLKQKMDAIDGDTVNIDGLWAKLKEYSVVPSDSDILSFEIKDGKGTLDASSLNTENKYVVALGNTLVENFSLTSLDINVNGEAVSSNYEYDTDYKKVE